MKNVFFGLVVLTLTTQAYAQNGITTSNDNSFNCSSSLNSHLGGHIGLLDFDPSKPNVISVHTYDSQNKDVWFTSLTAFAPNDCVAITPGDIECHKSKGGSLQELKISNNSVKSFKVNTDTFFGIVSCDL